MLKKNILGAYLLLMLVACSQSHQNIRQRADTELQACAQTLSNFDRLIKNNHLIDPRDSRVIGFPYLRVNRFLAGIQPTKSGPAFNEWLLLALNKGLKGWAYEVANSPKELLGRFGNYPFSRIKHCGIAIFHRDKNNNKINQLLKYPVQVPDNYSLWKRFAGVYWLSRIPFAYAVKKNQAKLHQTFIQPVTNLPIAGTLYQYHANAVTANTPVIDAAIIARWLQEARKKNKLNLPLLSEMQNNQLFEFYAPVIEVDVKSNDDRIGEVVWQENNKLRINTKRPVAYKQVSLTRFNDEILLQLNYIFWFPARPKQKAIDLLAGKMDGIVWRVTLDKHGKVLLYDSIHQCGCYHLVFPVAKHLSMKENKHSLIARTLSYKIQHPVIRIQNSSHYVLQVHHKIATQHRIEYAWRKYNQLRSLVVPNLARNKSSFASNAIMPGTTRSERFYFWPMGIMSAGAMRLMGHQPIAFVGRLHFDDIDIFTRIFN